MDVSKMMRNARVLPILAVVVLIVAGVGPAVAAGVSASGATSSGATTGGATTGGATGRTANGATGAVAGTSFQIENGACSFPVSVTDDTGENVTITQEPDRVVALGANIAQIAWVVGEKDKIVGMPVNPTTAYLNGSENRTDIYKSDNFHVATETVVGLKPDLVLAANIIPNETVTKLRDAGLTVVHSPFGKSITDAYGAVNQTGRLLGACGAANQTVETMRTQVNTIESTVKNEDRPRVLYGTNYVAGNGTFIGEIITETGGTNLAAEANITGYQKISDEVVVNRDPEWLVVTNASTIPTTGAFANTTAVRENQTIVVNDNYLNQIGPLIVKPMTKIARTLHPDAIGAANLSNVSFLGTGANATNATTTAETTTTGITTTAGTTTAVSATTTPSAPGTGTTSTESSVENGTAEATDTTLEATTTTASEAGTTTAEDTTTPGATTGETTTGAETTTSDNGPGFGIVVGALAVLGAGLLAARRRR